MSARDELLALARWALDQQCGVPGDANRLMAAVVKEIRAKALADAIEAARLEYLVEDLDNERDRAYQEAVGHVIAAIRDLIDPEVNR